MVGLAFTNEDFRSSECDWKDLLLCIETDELTELRKHGKGLHCI